MQKKDLFRGQVGYFWLCYSIMSVKKLYIGFVLLRLSYFLNCPQDLVLLIFRDIFTKINKF